MIISLELKIGKKAMKVTTEKDNIKSNTKTKRLKKEKMNKPPLFN